MVLYLGTEREIITNFHRQLGRRRGHFPPLALAVSSLARRGLGNETNKVLLKARYLILKHAYSIPFIPVPVGDRSGRFEQDQRRREK